MLGPIFYQDSATKNTNQGQIFQNCSKFSTRFTQKPFKCHKNRISPLASFISTLLSDYFRIFRNGNCFSRSRVLFPSSHFMTLEIVRPFALALPFPEVWTNLKLYKHIYFHHQTKKQIPLSSSCCWYHSLEMLPSLCLCKVHT